MLIAVELLQSKSRLQELDVKTRYFIGTRELNSIEQFMSISVRPSECIYEAFIVSLSPENYSEVTTFF